MKPATIPDSLNYGRKTTLGAPEDTPEGEVLAVEAVVDQQQGGGMDGAPRIGVRIELEPGDLEKLQARPYFWIMFLGGVHPFMTVLEADVADDEPEPPGLIVPE